MHTLRRTLRYRPTISMASAGSWCISVTTSPKPIPLCTACYRPISSSNRSTMTSQGRRWFPTAGHDLDGIDVEPQDLHVGEILLPSPTTAMLSSTISSSLAAVGPWDPDSICCFFNCWQGRSFSLPFTHYRERTKCFIWRQETTVVDALHKIICRYLYALFFAATKSYRIKDLEPEILRRGKAFHRRVQNNWKKTARNGTVCREHRIEFTQGSSLTRHSRAGRLDLFIDELGDFVSVVEIKSTDWDRVKQRNIRKLLGEHRRQVWRYIYGHLYLQHLDICSGIIYPHPPTTPGLKEKIEDYFNEYGLQVVWYEDPD